RVSPPSAPHFSFSTNPRHSSRRLDMDCGQATPPPPKRAFLVLGPESSGTRLVTRCLIAAGCQGCGDHAQDLDASLDGAADLIVWRRSLPHGSLWPDLREMLLALRSHGYAVQVLVTVRSHYCMVRSQIRARHVQTSSQAERNIA